MDKKFAERIDAWPTRAGQGRVKMQRLLPLSGAEEAEAEVEHTFEQLSPEEATIAREAIKVFSAGDTQSALAMLNEGGFEAQVLTRPQKGGSQPGAGRPLLGQERMREYRVTLPPLVAARLRELGDGNLSAGIRRALANVKKPA